MTRRLAFIMPGKDQGAANRYRFLQYLRFFNKDGFSCDMFWPHTKGMKGKFSIKANKFLIVANITKLLFYILTRNYAYIFIQKHILHPKAPIEFFLPKSLKNKLILDIDDAVFQLNPSRYSLILRSTSKVIAGSDYLKKYCDKYSKNVIVVPTSVDLMKIDVDSVMSRESKKKNKITFGWIGSPSGLEYITTLHRAFQRLNKILPLELVVISDFTIFKKVKIENICVSNIQWEQNEEHSYFSKFDIGIMPLDKYDVFIMGKCSFKVIQYMANKVPVLCSNLGNNAVVIQSGVNGYLYDNDEEFISQSLRIANNPVEVKKVVETAYNDVLRLYSAEKNYLSIRNFIENAG